MYQQKLSGLGQNATNSPRGGSFWGGNSSPLTPVRSDGSWSLRAVTSRNTSLQHGAPPSATPRTSSLSRASSVSEPRMAETSPKRRLTLPAPPPDGQENSHEPLSLAMLTKQGSGAQSPLLGINTGRNSPDPRGTKASPQGWMHQPTGGDVPLRTHIGPLSRANGPPASSTSTRGPLESGSPTKSPHVVPTHMLSSGGASIRSGGIGKAPTMLHTNGGLGQGRQQSPPGPFQQGLQMNKAASAGRVGPPVSQSPRPGPMQSPSGWQREVPVGPGPLAAPMVQQQRPVNHPPPQASSPCQCIPSALFDCVCAGVDCKCCVLPCSRCVHFGLFPPLTCSSGDCVCQSVSATSN